MKTETQKTEAGGSLDVDAGSADWLTDEIVHRWMREWNIAVEHQPEYGESPYQCVATRGVDAAAAQHMEPWGAVKAACTLAIIRRLWLLPNDRDVPRSCERKNT